MSEHTTISLGEMLEATFIERPNRYLGIADLKGERIRAHVPDPGRLSELLVPGARVYVRRADAVRRAGSAKTERKTQYDLLLVDFENTGVLVSIYTQLPNRLMRGAFESALVPEFADHRIVRPEFRHGASRLDFRLSVAEDGPHAYVEVKSVSLLRDGIGLFPDAPTTRGLKHVEELTQLRRDGVRTAVVFVAQRGDIPLVRPEANTDPNLAAALRRAYDEGVELYAWNCAVSTDGVRLNERIPVEV
jgi:sugar fermentation stimulation protein A